LAENSVEVQKNKGNKNPANPEKTEPHQELNGKQKAALVVVSLGADRASQIYKYLGEHDVEELTFEVAKMGRTTNSMVEDTLEQFYRLCVTHKMMTDGGMEYARAVLEKAFGATAAKSLLDRVSHTLASRPFNFFSKGDPKALLSLLQNERPQVIALILSYMDAEQAAQILETLVEAKRIPTVVAMAKMDRVSPEAIAIVEEEMRRKFDTIITSEDNMNLGGIDFVADVMNHIDRSNEKKIFDELDVTDPDLSTDIKDKMFVFEDILLLDNKSIQRVLRDVDNNDLSISLKNVSEEVQTAIFTNLSKRLASMIKEEMEFMGPVRVKDVEEAQQKIVNIIRKLEDSGEIIISRGGGDEIIV